MALIAAMIGVASVVLGLLGSLKWDTPSGPSIVVAALLFFIAGLLPLTRCFTNERKT
jgi:zinc transport system permease protein